MRRWIAPALAVLAALALWGWWGGGSGPSSTDALEAGRPAVRRTALEGGGPRPDGSDAGDDAAAAGPSGDGTPDVVADPDDPDREPTDAEIDARVAELMADPRTHLVCDLGVPVRSGSGYLAIGGHSGFNGRLVEVYRGRAYMPLVYDLGELGDATFTERSGVFSLDGHAPADIAWTDPPSGGGPGSCTARIDPEPATASLTGTLTVSPSGQPAAGGWVEGCGNLAFADAHGVVHMDIVSSPCTVIAMRQDGMLRTVSAPVQVTPIPGRDVIVDIVIPEAPRAGLGVQISQTDAGIVIDGVVDGGPAGTAGLQAGDLVVEVDGQPAADLALPDFVELVGGEAGTEVTLGVQRDGERLDVTIVRDVLPG